MKDRWVVEWKPGSVWGPYPPETEFADLASALRFMDRVYPAWKMMDWRIHNRCTGEIREQR